MFRPFEAKPQVGDAVLGALPALSRVIDTSKVIDLGSLDPGAPLEVRPPRLVAPPLSDLLPPFQVVSSGPVGGRLASFVPNWRAITSDAFIISVVTHVYLISPTPVWY